MSILNCKEIQQHLDREELIITPLLQKSQIKETGIDLRLGSFFKVERPIREPFIDIKSSDITKFFDNTYRDFGDDFILYPNQLTLANTFEYVKIPSDAVGYLLTRSSINRLGISIMSVVQPGYMGTLTLELINNTNTPIKLTVGMRIVQLLLNTTNSDIPYVIQSGSKYIGNISPNISYINKDSDLAILEKLSETT